MYIHPETLSNQSTPAAGLLELTPEQEALYLQYSGFIIITNTDPVEIEPDINEWETWQATLPDPTLEVKAQKIAQTKSDLEAYLLANPLQWTDGEYYAITAEKQSQLTSKIMAATLAAQTSTPYTLTWNSTGEVCKAWTLTDLSALAFAIDARVTSLVTYQQQKEVEIRNCETVEAVNAVVVDYDTVQ